VRQCAAGDFSSRKVRRRFAFDEKIRPNLVISPRFPASDSIIAGVNSNSENCVNILHIYGEIQALLAKRPDLK
jgi:hypothetical protein